MEPLHQSSISTSTFSTTYSSRASNAEPSQGADQSLEPQHPTSIPNTFSTTYSWCAPYATSAFTTTYSCREVPLNVAFQSPEFLHTISTSTFPTTYSSHAPPAFNSLVSPRFSSPEPLHLSSVATSTFNTTYSSHAPHATSTFATNYSSHPSHAVPIHDLHQSLEPQHPSSILNSTFPTTYASHESPTFPSVEPLKLTSNATSTFRKKCFNKFSCWKTEHDSSPVSHQTSPIAPFLKREITENKSKWQ